MSVTLTHARIVELDRALPIVHLNGTSREALTEQRYQACKALGAAYDALREMAPNGRDYYPAGPEQMERARALHHARLLLIDQLISELEYESETIDAA